MSASRVLLIGPRGPLADETERSFSADGATVVWCEEPADPLEVARSVIEASRALGGLDVVARFPGLPSTGAMKDVPTAAWAADVDRLLVGAFRVAVAAAEVMAAEGTGSIVVIGTVDAFHAYPGRSTASVAMGGMLGLVRSLGIELAGSGIRANAVVVGPMEAGQRSPAPDAESVQRTLLRSPSARFVTPPEAAAAIRFVAGPSAGFMTGQCLRVDAGWASLNQAPDGMKFR